MSRKNISIFIIDDDKELADLLKEIMEYWEFKIVDVANDGEIAIDFLKKSGVKPDFVLLDYRMPNMNGIETLKQLKKICPETKIIFTSADDSVKSLAFEFGAVEFLVKPFDLPYLREIIIKLSMNKHEREQKRSIMRI
ncbi:MAG: response regulator [Promethearchaeota archaeon]